MQKLQSNWQKTFARKYNIYLCNNNVDNMTTAKVSKFNFKK
jgi:hypothetical protein